MRSLARWPRSKCPSCYFVSLFDVVSVRADGRKNVLCCAQTSLALFDKKRDLTRVDRQDDRVGEGDAGERTARGCPRDVPRCRCSSPRPPHHFSCRGVVSVHLRGTQFSACVCVLRVWFLAKWFAFSFFSMPSRVLRSRSRPQLVARRTKRRDASQSGVIGEQPPFAWDFSTLSAHISRSLALCQEMTDTHVVSCVCVYLMRWRESMMGHCGQAMETPTRAMSSERGEACVPPNCAHFGSFFFSVSCTQLLSLNWFFPASHPLPPTCLLICSFYQFDCV